MRVCMVSSLYPPETIGGAEKYVRNVSERLVADGHEVHVVATGSEHGEGAGTQTQNGVTVHRISPLGCYTPFEHREAPGWQKPLQHVIDRWNPDVYVTARRLLRDIDPDVVHTHNFGGLSTAVFTAASRQGAPIIHTLHDYRLLDVRPALWKDGQNLGVREWMAPLRWFNRLAVDRPVDRVLSPSKFMLDLHREHGFFSDTECTHLPLGIEPSGVSSGTDVSKSETNPDSIEEIRLLFVGQLTAQKGVRWLVETISSMDRPDVRLDVLGKGPELDALKTLAAADDRIHVHGFVSEQSLDEFYRRADATIVSSKWYDNSPMVIYESYFQGTPVLGADIGGIPELIKEGTTGFCFDPSDPTSLREAIRTLIEADQTELRQGVERVRERYTMDEHISNLVNEYEAARRQH